MRFPGSPPLASDRCACGHPKRRHVQSVWNGVAPGLETACDVRSCYCLAFVKGPVKEARPG